MSKHTHHWFSDISITRKISLLLCLIFASSMMLGGSALAYILQRSAQDNISGQAVQLMGTMNAIRSYTNDEVSPLFRENLSEVFIPAALPTFTAREVFSRLMDNNPMFKEYRYKDAVLDPTNPKDQADSFEIELIEQWKSMPLAEKEIAGYRKGSDGDRFFISRPIRITQESCLACHSTPDKAPRSMVELYGTENGFNWPLNQVIGTQIVEVPVSKVESTTRHSFFMFMGILVTLFTTSTFALNKWLKHHIIRPIKQISRAAEAVSVGDLSVEFRQTSKDEIGLLAASFSRMKTSISLAIQRLESHKKGQP